MFGWLKLNKLTLTKTNSPAAAGSPGRSPETADEENRRTSFNIDTDALKPHPLLALLPKGTLERLLSGPELAEYPKGTVIFREGEPCDAIYLIVSGRCESLAKTRDGTVVEEVFGPGDTLGERAFLNREPYRSTVLVATHCVLLRVPGDELQGLFAKNPTLAGRFAYAVTDRPLSPRTTGRRSPARRIVSFLALSTRVDAPVVIRLLAAALHRVSGRSVLLVQLGAPDARASMHGWERSIANFNGTFHFSTHIREEEDGFNELRLSVGPETRDTAAIAPLLSHCGRHFDFVLLDIHHEVPVPAALACAVESDLSFVLMQPSAQNLYDLKLLVQQLGDRCHGACAHVKPILFVDESIATPDFHITLKEFGYPVHSIVRGFPVVEKPTWPDHRFDLWLNRLAREIARCRVGLALSSGAAKGLAHIGVIQVLEENGIEVDCIAGASMGAYIGSIWAYGLDGQQLEKIAREHEGRWGIFSLLDPAFPPRRGFFRARRTAARLRRSIGHAHFSELIRPLRVIATRIESLERVVFSCGEVAQAVEASIAIPGVVVPVTFEGETYIDGGIADPLPVDVLEEMGIERIIAVNVIPPPERMRQWQDAKLEQQARLPRHRSLLGLVNQHINYLADGNIIDVMMQAVNGAQMRVAEAASREADVLLRPISGDACWHDFTHPQKYIDLGRRVAEAQLSELKALALPATHDTPAPSTKLANGSPVPA